jgi:serine phosphatase RsbU (regulator of sigma subunit)
MKFLKTFIFTLLFFLVRLDLIAQSNGNQNKIDSLTNLLKVSNEDTSKVDLFLRLSKIDRQNGLEYAKQALELSEKLKFKKGIVKANITLGFQYGFKGNVSRAIQFTFEAVKILENEKNKNESELTELYETLGRMYWDIDVNQANKYFTKALKVHLDKGNKKRAAGIYVSLSSLNFNLTENDTTSKIPEIILTYILSALKIYTELNDKESIAHCYQIIGRMYSYTRNKKYFQQAFENFNKSRNIYDSIGLLDKSSLANAEIGQLFIDFGSYTEAKIYFDEMIKAVNELKDSSKYFLPYKKMGDYYKVVKKDQEAMFYYAKVFSLLKVLSYTMDPFVESNSDYLISHGRADLVREYFIKRLKDDNKKGYNFRDYKHYYSLYKVDSALKNYNDALINYKFYVNSRDSSFNLQNITKQRNIEAKYENEKEKDSIRLEQQKQSAIQELKYEYEQKSILAKSEQERLKLKQEEKIKRNEIEYVFKQRQLIERKEQEKKDALVKEEIERQRLLRNSFISGFVLMLSLAGTSFYSYRRKKKDNLIIAKQKAEVESKKIEVEVKNREIIDSIEYALRIQTAILPPRKIVKQYLENSFILYKPKDIVAGDFYWMETVDDLVLFAACDCTGHGVPGAMVSVVCHNALNRAVREYGLTQPALILDKTTELVLENFSRSEEDIKDGMDISLCALDTKNNTMQWAGANNPLWLVYNGELLETKANKQPIGMDDNSKPFTNHTFNLNKNTSIYLFTDGFADQFGGETGQKKLTKKRFKELILSIQNYSMQDQELVLDKFITDYRKEIEQIDDVCVIGIRI